MPHEPPPPAAAPDTERRFHGWRLLGVIVLVVIVLAGVSALVDWIVLGSIETAA